MLSYSFSAIWIQHLDGMHDGMGKDENYNYVHVVSGTRSRLMFDVLPPNHFFFYGVAHTTSNESNRMGPVTNKDKKQEAIKFIHVQSS